MLHKIVPKKIYRIKNEAPAEGERFPDEPTPKKRPEKIPSDLENRTPIVQREEGDAVEQKVEEEFLDYKNRSQAV